MTRVLVLFLVLGTSSAMAQATFHGNVARTGVYESPGPRQLNGVKWTFKSGGPIVASPAVADGVVYIASMDTYLYAIDQETGKEKWKFKSRMPIAGGGWRDALLCFFQRCSRCHRYRDRQDQVGI